MRASTLPAIAGAIVVVVGLGSAPASRRADARTRKVSVSIHPIPSIVLTVTIRAPGTTASPATIPTTTQDTGCRAPKCAIATAINIMAPNSDTTRPGVILARIIMVAAIVIGAGTAKDFVVQRFVNFI